MIETLRAIHANRYPRAQSKKQKKPSAQPELLGVQGNKFKPDPAMLAAIDESKQERGTEA